MSFDFRVIPLSLYEDNPRRTVVMQTELVIGGYWERLDRESTLTASA